MPVPRRTFLAGLLAGVAGACSGEGAPEATPSPTTPRPAPATTVPSTTVPATTVPATTAPATTIAGPSLPVDPFTLGVASGDPAPDGVVLWTRLAPSGDGAVMPAEPVPVRWELANDDAFAEIVVAGTATARPEHAHSVHVEVSGLPAGQWFRYRFHAGDWTSPVGTTRTMPGAGTPVDELRIGHASCQHLEHGWYAAHRDIAGSGLDLLVWLGDYIYEGAGRTVAEGRVRAHAGGECATLADYRDRYAQYRSDPDLQAAHAACPWLVIWDDHEVENNYAGDRSEDGVPDEVFRERRAAAYQAWWEHQPVRIGPPDGAALAMHREVRAGGLATFYLLDGRQHRDDQVCGDVALSLEPPCPELADPARTLLGADQEAWLTARLGAAATTWRVLANPVVLTDLTLDGVVLNYDQWDGYPGARDRLLATLRDHGGGSAVVLTGDIHLAGVADVQDEAGAVATELVSSSISSPARLPEGAEVLLRAFDGVHYVEPRYRGWVRSTVRADSWRAEYRVVEDVTRADSAVRTDATFRVVPGRPGAVREGS